MAIRDFLLGCACAAAVAGWFARPSDVAAVEPGALPPQFVITSATGKFGGPLLFVLDTKSKVLSVYEAEGGTQATRGLTWIAARKIEYDVNTTLYNDKSDESYSDMKQRFDDAMSKRIAGSQDDAAGSAGNGSKDAAKDQKNH